MERAAKYYSFLLLHLFPPDPHPISVYLLLEGRRATINANSFGKCDLKKTGIRINFLPYFKFLFCEKHCPESHKVLQLPLVEAERNLGVEGESRSWKWKPQHAKCDRAPPSELALFYFFHHLFWCCSEWQTSVSPAFLITTLIKSTFSMRYTLVHSRALNYRAGGVSVC